MELTAIEQLDQVRQRHQVIPVPVVAIARDLGIALYETEDFDDSQSGSIKNENGHYIIYVNARQAPTRKRFTIAHELSHYVLHRAEIDKRQELIDYTKQPTDGGLYRTDSHHYTEADQELERQANELAAEILMPDREFNEIWQTADTIEEVAHYFNVSTSAATIRAKTLFGEFMI